MNRLAKMIPILFASGAAAIVNLLTNGDMETGDPPTGWNNTNATLSSVADARPGSSGTKCLQIVNSMAAAGLAQQAITGVANGQQVTVTAWVKKIDTNPLVRIVDASGVLATVSSASTDWTQVQVSATIVNNASVVIRLQSTNATIGLSSRHDDVIAWISG
jgi:hypothetical protein